LIEKKIKKNVKGDKPQKIAFVKVIPDVVSINNSETKQFTLIQEKFTSRKYNLYRASVLKFDGLLHTDQSYGRDNDQTRVYSVIAFKNTDQFLPRGSAYIAHRNNNNFGFEKVAEVQANNIIPNRYYELHLEPISFLDAQRRIIDYRYDQKSRFIKETVSIRIRARDADLLREPFDTITIVDTLYRWNKYNIESSTVPHEQREDDPNAISFNISLTHAQPEKVVQYTVHYTL